jgi:transcription elongation factor S-II
LRERIINGEVTPHQLVNMKNEDLATSEQLKQKNDNARYDMESRQTDWKSKNRAEILTSIGLDPNKGGEITCRKCGGNKTTFYPMQTRSSDEPMTLFVTCLTCGKRWRQT